MTNSINRFEEAEERMDSAMARGQFKQAKIELQKMRQALDCIADEREVDANFFCRDYTAAKARLMREERRMIAADLSAQSEIHGA